MKKIISVLAALLCVVSMLPVAASAEEPTAKPVAWYGFDDEDNIGKDQTGNGNDLNILGEPVTEEAEGPKGTSAFFDGVSGLYATADDNGYDFVDKIVSSGTKQLTIAFWVQNESIDYDNFDVTSWRRMISNGHDGGAYQEDAGNAFGGFTMLSLCDSYGIPTSVNAYVMVDRVESHDGSMTGCNKSQKYEEAKWNFVVWTVDVETGEFAYYVNGESIYNQTANPTLKGGLKLWNTARAFALGGNVQPNKESGDLEVNHPYTGSLDEVMIFDTVLSESDRAYYMEATSVDLPETTPAPTTEPVTTKPKDTTPEDTTTAETTTDADTTTDNAGNTADTTAADTSSEGNEDGISIGLIIGIIAGVVVVCAVVAVLVLKKKK